MCELAGRSGLFGSAANLELLKRWRRVSPPGVLVGGFQSSRAIIEDGSAQMSAPVVAVTHDLLLLLGVQPAVGRRFDSNDYRKADAPPVILSWRLAQDMFGSPVNALGRQIKISGNISHIAGVMPIGFHVPLSLANGETQPEAWIPLVADNSAKRGPAETPVEVLLRIHTGTPPAYVASLFNETDRDGIHSAGDHAAIFDLKEIQSRDLRAPIDVIILVAAVMMIVGMVGMFLFLAMRGKEAANQARIKLSLGATRWRASSGQVVEGAILGFAAGVLGAWCSWYCFAVVTRLLSSLVAPGVTFTPLPALVVAFAAALLAGTSAGVFATLVRPSMGGRLRPDIEGASRSKTGWTIVSLAAEAGIAVCLGACLIIVVQTYARLALAQSTYNSPMTIAAVVNFPQSTSAEPGAQLRLASRLYQNLRFRPEFRAVSIAGGAPVLGGGVASARVTGRVGTTPVYLWSYIGSFFQVMGMHVLKGSLPEGHGDEIVIDESAATTLFGDGQPVGKTISWGSQPRDFGTVAAVLSNLPEIYGVQMGQIRLVSPPHIYVPFARAPTKALRIVATLRGRPEAGARQVEATVAAENPSAVVEAKTMAQWAGARLAREGLLTGLLAIYAAIALFGCGLSVFAIGLYGVSSRQRELAIRMALGAGRARIAGLIFRASLFGTMIGIAIGAVAAWAAIRVMAGLLLGTEAARTASVAGAVATIATVCLVAALPAVLSAMGQPIANRLRDV